MARDVAFLQPEGKGGGGHLWSSSTRSEKLVLR